MNAAKHRHARPDLGGEFPGDSWEDDQVRWAAQDETSKALAESRHESGFRLTDEERAVCARIVRYGSDAYPVHKLGRHWTYDWPHAPLYPTKRKAWFAFQILSESWSRLATLEHVAAYRAAAEEKAQP